MINFIVIIINNFMKNYKLFIKITYNNKLIGQFYFI